MTDAPAQGGAEPAATARPLAVILAERLALVGEIARLNAAELRHRQQAGGAEITAVRCRAAAAGADPAAGAALAAAEAELQATSIALAAVAAELAALEERLAVLDRELALA